MVDINLSSFKKVHFIGIGGISMSGLAETLIFRGFSVSGSDSGKSDLIEKLKEKGANIFSGHSAKNINEDIDLVVYTAAIKDDNEELKKARERNIKTIDRADLLGLILKGYEYPICVSGMHGKTTATSIISTIFLLGGLEPSINLGGKLSLIKSNYSVGTSEYFIAEACEYCDSFLKFFPYVGVVLNIEPEHLDYFRDLAHIRKSFRRFAENICDDGVLVINKEIDNLSEITDNLKCAVVTYGINEGDFFSKNITFDENGLLSFDVYRNNSLYFHLDTKMKGEHNVYNLLASIASADYLNIDKNLIKQGCEHFGGTERRFEHKGEFNGFTIVDDYAHHPTEIEASIKSARNSKFNKLYVVFQPHTYTRTKLLKQELLTSLKGPDVVCLVDIYAAREIDYGEVSSKEIADELKSQGVDAHYFKSFKEAEEFFIKNCVKDDLLITMGAGDVYLIGENILSSKKE